MPRSRNPEDRLAEGEKSVRRIKRRYKVNTKKDRKLLAGEKEHISEMVVVLKLAGYSHTQIGSVVGISRGQVGEMLQEPEIAEKLVLLRTALPQAALDLLHGYTIEAVQAIADVMRSSEDDSLIIKAASEILDRAGIAKVSKAEQHRTNENKTTFSTEDGLLEALRSLPPEKQEEAAAMMEEVEKFLNDSTKGQES